MKIDTLDISAVLTPFNVALGDHKPKIVNDIKSLLGREEAKGEKDAKQGIQIKLNDWKATAKFALKRSTGETLQLPANNPATFLLCFGMRMTELSKAAGCEMQCSIPEVCKQWVMEHSRNKNEVAKTTTVPA